MKYAVGTQFHIPTLKHFFPLVVLLIFPTVTHSFNLSCAESCDNGYELFQHSCYKLSSDKQYWSAARIKCENKQGSLLSLSNDDENEYILSLLQSQINNLEGMSLQNSDMYKERQFWIGLSMEEPGIFSWSDGSSLNYTHWGFDQPDNYMNSEECVAIWFLYKYNGFIYDGEWNDINCFQKLRYVCKAAPVCYEQNENEEDLSGASSVNLDSEDTGGVTTGGGEEDILDLGALIGICAVAVVLVSLILVCFTRKKCADMNSIDPGVELNKGIKMLVNPIPSFRHGGVTSTRGKEGNTLLNDREGFRDTVPNSPGYQVSDPTIGYSNDIQNPNGSAPFRHADWEHLEQSTFEPTRIPPWRSKDPVSSPKPGEYMRKQLFTGPEFDQLGQHSMPTTTEDEGLRVFDKLLSKFDLPEELTYFLAQTKLEHHKSEIMNYGITKVEMLLCLNGNTLRLMQFTEAEISRLREAANPIYYVISHVGDTEKAAKSLKEQLEHHPNMKEGVIKPTLQYEREDLPFDQLMKKVLDAKNVLILLSPNILSDSSCIVEIFTAIKKQKNIVIVNVQQGDSCFEFGKARAKLQSFRETIDSTVTAFLAEHSATVNECRECLENLLQNPVLLFEFDNTSDTEILSDDGKPTPDVETIFRALSNVA